MTAATLRKEEALGLGVAVALHAALVAVLLLQPPPGNPPKMPERMTVSLAEDVGLTAQAPEPVAESRASIAPTLAEQPAPPVPAAIPEPIPAPRPVQTSAPAPRPTPSARPTTRPAPRATTSPRPTASPTTRPSPRPSATASRAPAPRPTATRAPAPRPTAAPTRSGGQRISDDFLGGAGSSTTTNETRIPASQIGASAKASIIQAIGRQIKPHWAPPNGPEVDKIVSYIRFRLNPDGTLNGRPTLVRQTGVNDTNKAQANRHAEQAIRAVQLAAPFELPAEYYEAWKTVTADLDWKLAQ